MSASPIPELSKREEPEHARAHGDGVRRMFDRIAPTYDLLNRVLSGGVDKRWREGAVRQLRSAPPGPVLDLCAGTMDLTALVDRSFPGERIVAADFAAQMLEAGRVKAPRAEVVVADAMQMPFADGEFAAAICGFGMRNLSDPARGAREVRRVLRPGGVFVTLEFFKPTRVATKMFHGAYARVVLPTIGGLLSGDRSAYRYLSDSMQGFLTATEYARVLEQSGFARVEIIELTLGIANIVTARADTKEVRS